MSRSARRASLCGLLTALAFVLSFVENLIPFPMPLPGMKLGLANIVTLYAVYTLGLTQSALIVIARCLLSTLLFGSPTTLPFSLAGGLLSLVCMAALRRLPALSCYGVSMAGSAAHNLGQILVAVWMTSPALLYYLQFLLPVSVVTGFCTALVYRLFERRFRAAFKYMRKQ